MGGGDVVDICWSSDGGLYPPGAVLAVCGLFGVVVFLLTATGSFHHLSTRPLQRYGDVLPMHMGVWGWCIGVVYGGVR